ncbi:hypothetical protein HU200_054614 [Digitaria exilis]|uniref:Uncharacterized protein n=1 Tax=Digitaria exilis TaxID=1010633 RepID=A0A835AK69_9POAL|nr:hypothetical protein HU200_054614 [Digitaria exilis]
MAAARSCGGTAEEKEQRRESESEGEEEPAGVAAVLDFDMLCASVALSAERRKGAAAAGAAGGDCGGGVGVGGGVQRMWEGDVVLDCLEDRRIALETACCPFYRFGKNMRRANLGSCFLQGMVYFILLVAVLVSLIAFSVTRHHIYLYMGLASVLSIAIYTGYFRRRIRKQFNIRGTESSMDDCVLHLICPCCTLCQEARTLEMNNVQCGVWHGRGDTICLGSNGEGNKAFAALNKASLVPIKSPGLCGMDRASNAADEHEPLVPPAQLDQV